MKADRILTDIGNKMNWADWKETQGTAGKCGRV